MKEINKGSQDGKGNAPPSKRSTPPGSGTNSRSGWDLVRVRVRSALTLALTLAITP